jgi:hypothetical protein
MAALASIQDADSAGTPVASFADPDWRGDRSLYDGVHEGCGLRPYSSILEQQRRVGVLIRTGALGGRLDAYQARRASFDLESIRVQAGRERDRRGDDEDRRAVQSRLDRLEACLRAAFTPDRRPGG